MLPGPFQRDRDAAEDIRVALAKAAVDGRNVLIDFGANWCPDCVVLDFIMNEPAVRPTLDRGFHLVRVDVGEFDRNLDIAQRYMPKLKGISTIVVLNGKGDVLIVAPEFADARYMNRNDVLPFLRAFTPPALRQ